MITEEESRGSDTVVCQEGHYTRTHTLVHTYTLHTRTRWEDDLRSQVPIRSSRRTPITCRLPRVKKGPEPGLGTYVDECPN